MKARPIDQLVYECMFPKPKPGDPQNFHDLLRRQLVPEVRSETACFYGGLDSREAQYPGLDYSFPPHRMRLSRFTWHRRLFRAIDALQLTRAEIAGLTKWEGTRWAKERFEKEQGVRIRDTTGDCIHDWVDPELRQSKNIPQAQEAQVEEMEDVEEEGDTEDVDEDADDSDMEIDHSVGVELNERLRAAAAQREAGNSTTVMDEEWEQWLKEAAEAGGIPSIPSHAFNPSNNASGDPSASAIHPRLLHAARLGQWHQIPDFLQTMVRENIEASNQRAGSSSSVQRPDTHSSAPRHTPQIPVLGSRSGPRSQTLILPSNMPARQTSTGHTAPNRSNLTSRLLEQRIQQHIHHQPQS